MAILYAFAQCCFNGFFRIARNGLKLVDCHNTWLVGMVQIFEYLVECYIGAGDVAKSDVPFRVAVDVKSDG